MKHFLCALSILLLAGCGLFKPAAQQPPQPVAVTLTDTISVAIQDSVVIWESTWLGEAVLYPETVDSIYVFDWPDFTTTVGIQRAATGGQQILSVATTQKQKVIPVNITKEIPVTLTGIDSTQSQAQPEPEPAPVDTGDLPPLPAAGSSWWKWALWVLSAVLLIFFSTRKRKANA